MLPTHNYMSKRRKEALIRRMIQTAKIAVQGGLSRTTRTCGNPNCRCHTERSKRHGPNLYLTFRTADGRSSSLYVPQRYEDQIQKAVSAWAKLWKVCVAIAELNRKRIRLLMSSQKENKAVSGGRKQL